MATANAAANGHLDCLRYAYFRGCPWFVDDVVLGQTRQKWNRAASTIGRAWLAHTYAPGGKGYARLAEAWLARKV
jgi:hypothetical protein